MCGQLRRRRVLSADNTVLTKFGIVDNNNVWTNQMIHGRYLRFSGMIAVDHEVSYVSLFLDIMMYGYPQLW